MTAALAAAAIVPGVAAGMAAPATKDTPPAKAAPAARGAEKGGPRWGYDGAEGPDHWGDLAPGFAACKNGKLQSPIDIPASRIASTDLDSFHFYYKPVPIAVIDNGHAIQIDFEPGNAMKVGGVPYDLVQAHFHRPGEERIDGKTFPMVTHMVHRSKDGRLAVIALLMERGAANPALDTVLVNLPKDKGG